MQLSKSKGLSISQTTGREIKRNLVGNQPIKLEGGLVKGKNFKRKGTRDLKIIGMNQGNMKGETLKDLKAMLGEMKL
jgi:hypothetical protein